MAEPIYDGWTPAEGWLHPRQNTINLEQAVTVLRQQCNLHLCPQDQEIFGKDCTCLFTPAQIAQALDDADAEYTARINDPRGG